MSALGFDSLPALFHLQGFVVQFELSVQLLQGYHGIAVVGLQFQGLFEVGLGFFESRFGFGDGRIVFLLLGKGNLVRFVGEFSGRVEMHGTEVVIRIKIISFDFDGFEVIGFRQGAFFEVIVGRAPRKVEVGVGGIQLNGFG